MHMLVFLGYYCILGATNMAPTDGITGDICPTGSYCPTGSANHIFCPNGTYMNHTGGALCYTCPAGSYCTDRDSATECPAGFYCPQGTGADYIPCPAGTYNPTLGRTQLSECTQCDGGKYCQFTGQANYSGDCSAGYYCTEGLSFLSIKYKSQIQNCFTGFEFLSRKNCIVF